MKKTGLSSLLLMAVISLQAQFNPLSPEVFLNMNVPYPPSESRICNSNADQKHEYRETMHKVSADAAEQIAYLRRDEKKDEATMKQQAMQKMQSEYGLSAEDMQKMQSGKMSKEEKKAMADKMLQQQNTGLTVDKAKEISHFSKEGKKAWAESYAEQQKAEAERDPKKDQEAMEQHKTLYELTLDKDILYRKLQAEEEKFGQQLGELEADSTGARMLREIDALTAEYMSLVGEDGGQGARMEELAGKIKSAKLAYCSRFTPKYVEVLTAFREAIKKNMPDYYRMEVLINEVNKRSSGTTVNMMQKGQYAYDVINGYLKILTDAYKYSIYDSDQPF